LNKLLAELNDFREKKANKITLKPWTKSLPLPIMSKRMYGVRA